MNIQNSDFPLIAILRGIKPQEAAAVGEILLEKDFRKIEVPLNSPDPYESIARIRSIAPEDALIGAGTVLEAHQIAQVKQAGGNFIVMPHTDVYLIETAKAHQMTAIPGFLTPTEAFTALKAGADILKWFPAGQLPSQMLKAIKTVLPNTTPVYAVGGMKPEYLEEYFKAGADGFGLGSELFKPGMKLEEIAEKAGYYQKIASHLFKT